MLASDLYRDDDTYWATLIEVSKNTTLARMQRSISILGRQEGESIDFAKLIYPAMQAADIFTLGVHIAHAGIDQRKAHVIARDVAMQMRVHAVRGVDDAPMKPVALHHPLLLGLRRPPVWPVPPDSVRDVFSAMKMSKSDPGSAVFVHDTPDQIIDKVRRAFCPPGEVTFNPILDWIDKLVFGIAGGPFVVDRSEANGGRVTFDTSAEVTRRLRRRLAASRWTRRPGSRRGSSTCSNPHARTSRNPRCTPCSTRSRRRPPRPDQRRPTASCTRCRVASATSRTRAAESASTPIQPRLVGAQLLVAVLDRGERIDDRVGDRALEHAVALALELVQRRIGAHAA